MISQSDGAEDRPAGSENGGPVQEGKKARGGRWLPILLMVTFAIWGVIVVLILATVATWHDRRHRALILMADGLVLFWIVIGGLLMRRYRDQAGNLLRRLPLGWPASSSSSPRRWRCSRRPSPRP